VEAERHSGNPSQRAPRLHTSITQSAELGQKAGLGLDRRHRSIATMLLYVDEHDRRGRRRRSRILNGQDPSIDLSTMTLRLQ
jgi:hypothetical protein